MKILVCVKQVPESEGVVSIERYEEWLRRAAPSLFRMNRFDEYAVEEAIRLKEVFPETRVDAITVGPKRCTAAVRRAMGMGADRGIHILTEDEPFLPPFAIASWIAARAEREKYDLFLAGVISEDGMHAQVGPMVAEILGIPYVTSVICLRLTGDRGGLYVEREIEGGLRDTLEVVLPAMVTVQSGINQPRYPSLSNMLRAGKSAIETVSAHSLPLPTPRHAIVGTDPPRPRREVRFLEGTASDKARLLVNILRERALMR